MLRSAARIPHPDRVVHNRERGEQAETAERARLHCFEHVKLGRCCCEGKREAVRLGSALNLWHGAMQKCSRAGLFLFGAAAFRSSDRGGSNSGAGVGGADEALIAAMNDGVYIASTHHVVSRPGGMWMPWLAAVVRSVSLPLHFQAVLDINKPSKADPPGGSASV